MKSDKELAEVETLRAEFPNGKPRELLERMIAFTSDMNALWAEFSDVPDNVLADWLFSVGCEALLQTGTEEAFRTRLIRIAASEFIDRGSVQKLMTELKKKAAH